MPAAAMPAAIELRPVEESFALKDRIYGELRAAILEVDVYAAPGGDRLDERQLADQLGVSRTPVREALQRLEHEGLVVSIPRRGTFVARKTKREIIETITAWAALGEGAWMVEDKDRRRLTVAAPAAVRDMGGSLGHRLAKRMEGRNGAPARTVRYRCVGREYTDLARGGLHFARYGGRLKPWDHAAGVLIHREAGGHGALIEGRAPYLPGDGIQTAILLLAPDAACWDALAAALSP